MSFILIDGYNLIGIAHSDLEHARNELIADLSRYVSLKGHDITVVFDGWKKGQAEETRLRTGNITVIYSRIGENADSVIKRFMSQPNRSWIVVSSDRGISDRAYHCGCVPLTSDEFEEKLNSALLPEEYGDHKPGAGTGLSPHGKGRPGKPSKKLRAKLRALEKL